MIPQYLSELLLRFDTVILPGLGLFHLKNIPASIKGDQIIPPGKILLFESSVKNNDGVLANYISEKNKISFFDACTQIIDFVEKIQKNLNDGSDVTLEKIGVLKKDTAGIIGFTADTSVNYNIDTFGLNAITAIPLSENQKENKSKSKEILSGKKKKIPVTAIWIISIVLFIGTGATTVYFIKPELFSKIGININPQKQDNSVLVSEKTPEHNPSSNQSGSVNQNDSINNVNQSNGNQISQTQQGNVRYYIIAASFRIKENANNYVIQLNSKKYKSESIFMPDKNLYVVSYNAYDDKTQAEQALADIRASGNQAAWILEK